MQILTMKEADRVMSYIVRSRDKKCFFGCGRPARQNSHFWGRGNKATRYDFLNCDGACGKCHQENEGNKQGLYRELKIKQLGTRKYDDLEKRARSIMKADKAILQFMDEMDIVVDGSKIYVGELKVILNKQGRFIANY